MSKINFASDNYAGAHPRILEALVNANKGDYPAYGSDDYTQKAIQRFQEEFNSDCQVFFVFNGTGANVTALASIMRSYEAVICAEKAHIQVDECGAPEKITGAKLLAVPSPDGKLSIERIQPLLERVGDQHHVQPRIISISQSTEYGTVYTLQEIKEIADFTHAHNMWLHMDGARLCNAAASLNVSLRELTYQVGVDVLSFGGTKNGLMMGEAVIFFQTALASPFQYIRKQSTQLASKMRFISAQFLELFNDKLWYHNAFHANKMAHLLAENLKLFPMITLTQATEANAIFALFPSWLITKLQSFFHFYVWNELTHEVRLMTSFNTEEADILTFVTKIKELTQ